MRSYELGMTLTLFNLESSNEIWYFGRCVLYFSAWNNEMAVEFNPYLAFIFVAKTNELLKLRA
jgi:hypothetical protein